MQYATLQEKIDQLPTISLTPNSKNLTNHKQGQLTFLKPSQRKNGRIYWWAICDCGAIIEVRADTKAKSCKKCRYKKHADKLRGVPKRDLTGKVFGRLTVLYPITGPNGHLMWHCKCNCGNEIDVTGANLQKDHGTRSCGCYKKELARKIGIANKHDLTGQKFGYLTVLQEDKKRDDSKRGVIWICQCICGKIVRIPANDLLKGDTKSCGCKKQELNTQTRIQKMIGRKFGKLTVLTKADTVDSDGSYNYLCRCDCGNLKIANGVSLRGGSVASCGCLTKSLGEQNIRSILTQADIPFEFEKTFDGCVFPDTKKPARYDFYIPNRNRLIEFDGRQHFEGWRWGYQLPEDQLASLKKIQEHDRFKNQWAKNHNIALVRIPYTERDHITLDMILGNKYLVY